MKRLTVALIATLALAAPAIATAIPPTPQHAAQYQRLYHQAARELGKRTPGRNILTDGRSDGHAVTDHDVRASIAVLQRMLAPPPTPASQSTPTASSTAYTAPTTYTGAVPACASESGTNYSTGPANTNASSGATGRYQIIPSTAAAYGCDLSTPAGQDSCAAAIYAKQGASAWVGCGG